MEEKIGEEESLLITEKQLMNYGLVESSVGLKGTNRDQGRMEGERKPNYAQNRAFFPLTWILIALINT